MTNPQDSLDQEQKINTQVVDSLIRQLVHEELEKVQKESAKEVIDALVPIIDDLISKKNREHLKEIAEFILSKTKEV